MLDAPWPFPAYRKTDPETSKTAMEPDRVATIAIRILKHLSEHSNQTCEDIANSMPDTLYRSISPRLIQLERKGFIERTGAKLSALNKSMLSYSITKKGIEKCSQS